MKTVDLHFVKSEEFSLILSCGSRQRDATSSERKLRLNNLAVKRLNRICTFMHFSVHSVEYVSDPHSKSIHGSHLVMWLRTVSILGACLVLLSITCFILFYAFLHLGWTVLSNNVCLLLISVSTALFQDRLVLVMGRIREDQHKAVIYESLLLLKECSAASANPTKHKEYFQKASDFSLAVAETELFTKPDHIFIDEQSIKKTDVVSNLQMHTFI